MENNGNRVNPLELCDAMYNVLDKISEASGRQKCGYIWVMNNLIDNMRAALQSEPKAEIETAQATENNEG